ncbi:hypothetical protein AOZ06_11705 [Kibdelosporangium phytohabitans]|uniref:Uncharacterized protein n=2 Tax=Kibdelosporangium phytohabitans TaxID=860235 RepID=A0A0N9IE43_9PSEU|nr:hypothetical protein AOZ06_11705 [Kibdelosporangium phytohabitans]
MRDTVALWHVGQANAAEIVYAACDLLVAGVDGPALRMLAAVSARDVRVDSYEVTVLLESVMTELGLPYFPKESPEGQERALKAMASRVLAGVMPPHELTCWVHQVFGHDGIDLAQPLVELDDVYDYADCTAMTVEDIDAQVLAEAKRLVALP